MQKVSFGVWELKAEEARKLVEGSQILCYDANYDKFTLLHARVEPIVNAERYTYYALEEPVFKKQEIGGNA